MPCYYRERQKFEIWKQQKIEQKQSGESNYNFNQQTNDEASEMFARLKKKLDDHIKILEDLRRKLRETTSESEKTRLRKEIEDLEKEVAGYEKTMDDVLEFVKDVERRTINTPSQDEN